MALPVVVVTWTTIAEMIVVWGMKATPVLIQNDGRSQWRVIHQYTDEYGNIWNPVLAEGRAMCQPFASILGITLS